MRAIQAPEQQKISEMKKQEDSNTYLIVIGGFAGAGKSTLARCLGRKLTIPFYEVDLIGRTIADSPDFKGTNPKGVAYDLFWVFARTHLENGNSIIFDQNMGGHHSGKNSKRSAIQCLMLS